MNTLEELKRSATTKERSPKRCDDVREASRNLLTCEAVARESLEKEKVQHNPDNLKLDRRFPRIDLKTALKSRINQPGVPVSVPRFVAFNVQEEECRIAASTTDFTTDVYTSMPEGINEEYKDVAEALGKHVKNCGAAADFGVRIALLSVVAGMGYLSYYLYNAEYVVFGIAAGIVAALAALITWGSFDAGCLFTDLKASISLKMAGVVPESARKIIQDNRHDFNHIYIVAEAKDWKYTKNNKVRLDRIFGETDPLIIGRKNGIDYLLGTFDLTDLETWLSKEFTSGKKAE